MRFFVAFAVLGAIALGQDCTEEGDAKSVNYRGKVAVGANGYRCQKWASQSPNAHTYTPEKYPDAGLDENYCRNPSDHTGLWCYNDEGTSPRWVNCDAPKCGQYLVKVICDDIANIFIDGVEKVVPGTGAWNQLSKFYVPATTTTIGIQCRNTGGPYGIMATVQNEVGETFVVSDNSWSCSNAAQDGWAAGSFTEGDSWKPAAYYYGHPPYLINKDAWRGMSNDKKVIWTASAADTTVYCRKDLPKPTDLTLDVICDDVSTIFVDGEQQDVAGTGAWNQLASVRISGDTKVVGVQCRNTGGPYGIMAQILDGSKKVVAVSDDSWSCSNAAEDGWSTGDFVEGDNWKPAAYYNGHPPYKTAQQAWRSMSLNKRIIWTASGADTTVYCRKVMPAAAPPKLAVSAAWKLIPGGLTKISKGKSGVWGVNRVNGIYRLNGDGTSWTKIAGGLVQVSSGASVWGVNRNDMIYRYKGGNQWENIGGRLTNVDVSENDNVWGVNRGGNIYRWLGTRWEQIGGAAIQVSVGNSGVWVVNSANNIYYRVGTYGDSGTAGTGWTHVPGKLKWISSGNNIVVGVNANNDIYYRSGMSADTPTGTGWNKVNGKLMNIDLLDDEVVGTNTAMNIFRCPMVAPPPPVKYSPCDETDSCVREVGIGALLTAGSQLVSKNGRAKLVMQDDGNLVLYCVVGGAVLWNSESNGKGVDSGLKLQDDGNMVLYAGDAAIWDSKTNGNTDAVELVVQNDHNVVLYSYEDRSVLWKTDTNGNNCPDAQFVENCAADKCIRESQVASILSLGKKIVSKNGKAVFTMQADGNLVLTCSINKNVLWKSDTSGVAGGLKFQSDGNLVLYDADRKDLWASDSNGNYDNAELVVQDDMNVVLYNSADRKALWATDTDGAECADPPSTVGTWSKNAGKYLSGYSAGNAKYDSLLRSQSECIKRSDCGGITYETNSKKFTLRRGVDLKDSPSNEISWLAISSDDEGGHIFGAKVSTEYELHKALEVGDVISAFGLYKDHTTSKFNLNIKGANNLFLLHVDFRPTGDQLVLNSNQPGVGWQAEVRPAFPKAKLVGGKIFKVSVEVLEGEYRILFNDEEVGKFPQRQSISLASHIILYGGSNGFEWKAAQLPPGVAGPGLSKPCGTGDKLHFDKTNEVGDIITVWGIFADKTSAFSVNLIKDDSNFMLHISFRPPPSENKIVLNSKLNGAWQTEIRAAMPAFVNGGPFKVQIELLLNEFKIYVNGNDIGVSFPYREGFSLGDIQFLYNVGGSNGMTFTDMSPPDDKNVGANLMSTGLSVSQNSVGWGGVPARAIDGNRNGIWAAATCTHSAGNSGNWWKVELGQMSAINRVVVYNRLDCCSDRINGAKVYAGANLCGEVKYEAGKAAFTVECGGAVGDSLTISQPYNYLTLCEVEIYGKPSDLKALANVAPGKPTWQSSVGWGGVPQRATDGGISGRWPAGTCTHSANAGSNKWKVDLLDMFNVDSVVIYNRLDCCSERINGAKVFVGAELCGAVEYVAGQSVYKIDCGGKVGSVIQITQDGQYLTLCEVQVLATPSDDLGTFLNVAADGVASQSNTGWNGVADRAIDGNIAGDYFDGASCSHTGNTVDGYWKLDFDDAVAVKQVVIYNREDCCADRINGVSVFAGDTLCGKIAYVEGQKAYKVGCNSDTVKMFESVTIKAAPNQYLTLCEVKVLADPRVESGDEHLANLAFGKPTSQTSTGWGGVSSRAVDGKEAGKWTAGSCTHTNGAGSWQVNLQDNYVIKSVWIKNRVDCCSNRINGVQVFVGDALCGTIEYNPIKYSYSVNCGENGIVGSSVKVVNPTTHLTLCEVKVWGPADPVVIEETTDEEVVGDKSAAVDDAVSQAKCPSGKVVSFCEVATGNTAVNADGALVKGDGGEICVAHNGWGGQGVIARAICSEQVQIASPCNGPKLNLYKKLYARGTDPSLKCPAGYEAIICNAHSFWWNMLVNKVDAKGIISNDKDCVVPSCNANNWCDITLVCKLMEDMDAYAEAVCPTCDGYSCEESFECQMIDDDGDDSDKKFPTCVEKQTGCDVDRCGDNGDCEPKGADDYICICSDGYEFDEIAGTCMPVHTKYRTVYGDEAIGDDAHSFATCSEGERVYRCHTFGAPSAADGVTIANTNGLVRCEARASHSKKFPVRAVGYCGEDNIFTDPCTQEDIHQIEYRIDAGLSPSISCPDGYLMESCIFHSPWTQALTDVNRARINSIGAVGINDDGSCSMTDCLKNPHGHQWCKLTAVCKKLTGSEYMKAACPTCDDVRCPDGQECGMVEDLPLCLPRVPGGCDADKCGENGECKEDGTDYECLCKTGYKFDSVTCIDIDECAEEPCGNGDCTNTAGSYTCDCKKGYEAVKGTCEDVDECADSPCSETERCSNIEGSFICDCLDTFIRVKKSKECVCADGFENQDGSCADIDECALPDSCGENEVCTNSVGNYQCECKEGTEKGSDGVCKEFLPLECDVKAKKPIVKGIKGTNVNVKLAGEVKKTFKKYATIKWEKNNEPWDPKSDGKSKFNGFTIRKFDAEDAGIYVASIYIEKDGESFKCEVEVKLVLLEGSVKLNIANAKQLSKKQKSGQPLTIKCDVDIDNLKLKDPKSPDNINWYRVTDDGDELLDDSDTISIERGKGTYQMILKNPSPEDSGTYRCEFDQQGVDTSTDVTIEFK